MSGDLCVQDGALVSTGTAVLGPGTGVASLHVVQARPVWPAGPALTARLRRLITAYQRFTLRREPPLRHDFLLHDGLAGTGVGGATHSHHSDGPLAWQLGEELRRCSVVATEPDPLFLEWQRRWTRREQADFYRTVSSYGVLYDADRKAFDWSQFRALARLERKTDQSLERYFNSFVNMCRTACKLPPRRDEGPAPGSVDPAVLVDPLTEERAARTLYRIELLRKIREQVLRHPLLSARLQLCRPSLYLPVWWESGKHDRDLLLGAARHGLSRTDFYILNDPQLSFLEAHRNYVRGHPSQLHPHQHPDLVTHQHPHLVTHPGMLSSSTSAYPHCCLYDSAQPPEYPHQSSQQHQHHPGPAPAPSPSSHLPPLSLDAHSSASPSLGLVAGSRGDFLDCPPLEDSLELGSLQHDAMSADALHGGKASKDALNGFPFNSAAGGQSMLNSYAVGGSDLDSKLRSDVLVGEQGSSEETGLMAPSVELDQLQAPWDGTDHSSPAHHMFNESDPILGPSALEAGFLEEEDEEAQGGRADEEGGTLEECLGLPPSSSPSHPSAGDPVEPLSSSYMLFKDISVSEEPSADQTDLSASPPLSLSDITAHEPQDRLGHSDLTERLADPVQEGGGQEEGAEFQFDDKEEEVGGQSRSETQNEEKSGDESLGSGEREAERDPRLGVLDPPMEVVPEAGLDQDEEDLQGGFDQSEHKEELPSDAHPYLGKLEQQGGLACPESIEEPGQEVDGLILYQTVEEETIESSLNTETLLGNTAREHPEDLAGQVDEISAGRVEQVSFMEVQPCEETTEKHTAVKPSEMVLQSLYTEYASPSCSTALVSPTTVALKAKNGTGLQSEESMDQENHDSAAEDLNSSDGTRDCKNTDLTFSLEQDKKDDLLEQHVIKMVSTLPADGMEIKPSGLKLSLLPDGGGEKKPHQLELQVKVEQTKAEPPMDVYTDSSDFRHGKFLSYRVKSEISVTKAEPEDLSPPMKAESLDRKPEGLQYSGGAKIKPEAKPVALRFAPYPDGAKLKTETEDFNVIAFPDTSAIKPEAKSEGLEFSIYPDGSAIKPEAKPVDVDFSAFPEIKVEMKQELLEADSTVLTPKLEQADVLVDSSESLVGKIQVKEERPATPVSVVEGYAGSPRCAAPVSRCDLSDSLQDSREPTIAQLLQEKALYSFSEWPKDRVIINRLDSICHAILKGKWPSSSEQYDSPGSCLANSVAQHHQHRASFLPTTASSSVLGQPRIQQTGPGLGFSIPPPLTRLPKERLVAPPYLPELKRAGGRRSFDYEAAAAAAAKVLSGKSAPSCHTAVSTSSGGAAPVVAPPSHHGAAMLINGWQETAIDLTKSSGETGGGGVSGDAVGAPGHQLPPPPPITAPLPGSVGMDMAGILQAGLIHPVTGQIVNGSLRGDDSLRRRRGRRRNVEALYSEFTKSRGLHLPDTQGRVELISHSSVSSSTSSPSPGPPTPSSTPTPTQTPPQPEIVAIDREAASKGLMEWLRQNPGYSMDLPSFSHAGPGLLQGFVERPKQRRHRCKDPTKLDINSLTGEERVPVVHRGTGRRLGGAMAPAIKELSRWLDANSEYYVAPDWADVVKHSGYLPEGKFCRILTEPVNRDPGSRRRGRRPRSEMPKPLLSLSDSAPSGLGPPLFMNGGLIGSMDSMMMQNLRSGLHGIPISGIMAAGFPHGFSAAVQGGGASASAEDAKNGLSMLPMMLHGIPHGGAVPQHALFSVGPMMAPHHGSSSSSSSSASKVTTTTAPQPEAADPPSAASADREGGASSGEKERSREERGEVIASAGRSHLAAAHLGAGSHLTFNPFLIPGMSHGLLYPHMFLPHGGIMALPAMPPGESGSPKRRRKRGREEAQREEETQREEVREENTQREEAQREEVREEVREEETQREEAREDGAVGKVEERERTLQADLHPTSPALPQPQEPDSNDPPEEEREEEKEEEEQRQVEGEEPERSAPV